MRAPLCACGKEFINFPWPQNSAHFRISFHARKFAGGVWSWPEKRAQFAVAVPTKSKARRSKSGLNWLIARWPGVRFCFSDQEKIRLSTDVDKLVSNLNGGSLGLPFGAGPGGARCGRRVSNERPLAADDGSSEGRARPSRFRNLDPTTDFYRGSRLYSNHRSAQSFLSRLDHRALPATGGGPGGRQCCWSNAKLKVTVAP